MASALVTLTNPSGLHARPAAIFAKAAAGYGGTVAVTKDERTVNAKSTLSLLTLDCHRGDVITIAVEGDDADVMLGALVEMVESGLGE